MSLLDCQPKDPEMMAAMEEQLEADCRKQVESSSRETEQGTFFIFSFFFFISVLKG